MFSNRSCAQRPWKSFPCTGSGHANCDSFKSLCSWPPLRQKFLPNTNDFGTPEAHRRFSSSLVIIISVCLDSQPTLSFVSSFKRIVELLVGGGWSCQGSWGRWGLFHACAEVAHTVAGSLEDTVFSVVSRTTNGPIVQQCQMLGALQVYTELKRKLRCFTHAVEKVANSPM